MLANELCFQLTGCQPSRQFKLDMLGFRCSPKGECQESIQNFECIQILNLILDQISFQYETLFLGLDLNFGSSLNLGSYLIFVSNLFWKRDSAFNSTQAVR